MNIIYVYRELVAIKINCVRETYMYDAIKINVGDLFKNFMSQLISTSRVFPWKNILPIYIIIYI